MEATDSRGTDPASATGTTVTGFMIEDASDWDRYVLEHDGGTIFHTLRWRDALRSTFQHHDRYLLARRDGAVVGILPLVEVSSMFFGTTLISVPFGVYGGLLVDDEEAARLLIDHARDLAAETNAKYVELRHLNAPVDDLPRTELYHTFIEPVPDTEEGCLARLPRKARAEVRKAIKEGVLETTIEQTSLEEFHELFSFNKRKLGSPLFPSSLFWHLREHFKDDLFILAIEHEGKTLQCVLSFLFKGTIMPYYSGALPGSEQYRAGNFMYYQLMCEASRRGCTHFDFGRSREGTGAFSFKKHQGFEPRQLQYDYILNTATEVPSLNPSNPKYRMAKSVFRRMPIWMAQKVGSWLVKRAPF